MYFVQFAGCLVAAMLGLNGFFVSSLASGELCQDSTIGAGQGSVISNTGGYSYECIEIGVL